MRVSWTKAQRVTPMQMPPTQPRLVAAYPDEAPTHSMPDIPHYTKLHYLLTYWFHLLSDFNGGKANKETKAYTTVTVLLSKHWHKLTFSDKEEMESNMNK